MNFTYTYMKFGTCYQCTLWIMHVKFRNHIPSGSLSLRILFNFAVWLGIEINLATTDLKIGTCYQVVPSL
jgi:hypothetical protein